jgi:hypothetical protein
MRTACVLAVIGLLSPIAASADILEWRDASGARHFTNHRETVPAAHRDRAEVLIVDVPRPDPPAEAVRAPLAQAAPPPVSPAEADERYLAGLRAGMRLGADTAAAGGGGGAAEGGAAAGGSVEINGPLAVTTVHVSDTAGDGAWFPGAYGDWSGYLPLVTTSFDRGRSRHQTLRMLLQDQFQRDRDGPYAYDRWTQPGLGPALSPALPRGLPPSVRQYGRVIYR